MGIKRIIERIFENDENDLDCGCPDRGMEYEYDPYSDFDPYIIMASANRLADENERRRKELGW